MILGTSHWLLKLVVKNLILLWFPDMPCMKRVTKPKRRRSTVRQPGTKRASRPADKLLIHRWSTAGFVPRSVYIGFRLFVRLKTLKRCFVDALERTVDFCFLCKCFCWHPILPDPAPLLGQALRPEPPVVCLGFGFDRFSCKHISSSCKACPASIVQCGILVTSDMPCMKRVYSNKKGVVPPFGSQEQSALLVPLINRWKSAGKLLVNRW